MMKVGIGIGTTKTIEEGRKGVLPGNESSCERCRASPERSCVIDGEREMYDPLYIHNGVAFELQA